MKKIVFSIVILVTMMSVNTYASQIFDNPPQKQWGQTRVDESCRDAGVSYDRTHSNETETSSVFVSTGNRADVNVTVERNSNGFSRYTVGLGW